MRCAALLVAIALGAGLTGAYVALGGLSYEPTPVADPCLPRTQSPTAGSDEALQAVVLSAADAAACGLGVSREELVLSLRSVDELEELAEREGVSRDELETSLREGLRSAVETARTEGLIGERTADVLAFAAGRLPLGLLLAVLRGGTSLLGL